ncbi:MAG: GntP family permease [Microbacteriaceae bacterium]
MPEVDLVWELPAWGLLLIAAGAIAALLVLIIKVRIHAFLALIIISLVTAVATGIAPGSIVSVMTTGFGNTLATVALLVGLGAILGRMIETSGGAQVMTDKLISVFGEKRAPLALSFASLLMGFPIFFDAGLVVMLPIIFAVARRLGGSMLLYAFPAASAFSVMHIFVPPHPGPVAAAGFYGADVGLTIFLGLLVALPTWYFAGFLFGKFLGRKFDLPVPTILGGGDKKDEDADEFKSVPKLSTIIFLLVLPLILIGINTSLNALATAGVVSLDDTWVQVLRLVGETPIALLITVLAGFALLGWKQGKSGSLIDRITDSALGPVCAIILITGAGGMFGGVLRSSGIGDAIADSLDAIGLPLIVAAYIIALVVRVAQGSATVALTTAAALMQPVVVSGSFNAAELSALVLATAAGSVFAGHVNDSGFWLISRFFGMSTSMTLKTWTVGQSLISVIGFAIAALIFVVAGLF